MDKSSTVVSSGSTRLANAKLVVRAAAAVVLRVHSLRARVAAVDSAVLLGAVAIKGAVAAAVDLMAVLLVPVDSAEAHQVASIAHRAAASIAHQVVVVRPDVAVTRTRNTAKGSRIARSLASVTTTATASGSGYVAGPSSDDECRRAMGTFAT